MLERPNKHSVSVISRCLVLILLKKKSKRIQRELWRELCSLTGSLKIRNKLHYRKSALTPFVALSVSIESLSFLVTPPKLRSSFIFKLSSKYFEICFGLCLYLVFYSMSICLWTHSIVKSSSEIWTSWHEWLFNYRTFGLLWLSSW